MEREGEREMGGGGREMGGGGRRWEEVGRDRMRGDGKR
jgi:hypothetical protein